MAHAHLHYTHTRHRTHYEGDRLLLEWVHTERCVTPSHCMRKAGFVMAQFTLTARRSFIESADCPTGRQRELRTSVRRMETIGALCGSTRTTARATGPGTTRASKRPWLCCKRTAPSALPREDTICREDNVVFLRWRIRFDRSKNISSKVQTPVRFWRLTKAHVPGFRFGPQY